jgi:hypothetical protein
VGCATSGLARHFENRMAFFDGIDDAGEVVIAAIRCRIGQSRRRRGHMDGTGSWR